MQPVKRAAARTVFRPTLLRPRTPSRPLSTSAPAPPPAPPPSGLATLTSRRLLTLSGPDAAKFLQGAITANLLTPSPSPGGFYAAFLTAQGRVLHDVFIYPSPTVPSTYLIEVDAAHAPTLQRHIKRYQLRSKFTVTPSDDLAVHHLWGAPPPPGGITLADPRAPGLGWRVLSPSPPEVDDVPRVSEETYRLRRYLHGVAEGQAEILRDAALPLESNLDLMGGVDFRKGCYVGQELTIRTKHRGVVRKRVLPCVVYPAGGEVPGELGYDAEAAAVVEGIPAETGIRRVGGAKGRDVGKWLRGVGNVGLALCRLEAMTDLRMAGEPTVEVGGADGGEFVVVPGGEKGEGGDGEVRIKAFVPEWMRRGLAEGR
ncbi:hypothetical protein QBC39DRAFT_166372 [Podospora conica]|nr:hypothetical protein QBC39DRAFT_166372 [Schizothecium conicum]